MKICKDCKIPLYIHKTKNTNRNSDKQYYYSAYYKCERCGKIFFDEKFKVENNTQSFLDDKDSFFKEDISIWTDGACLNNGKDNAVAVWAFVSGIFEESGRVSGKQTNNTAEGYAVYYALLWAVENKYKNIKIFSDSQITINNLKKPYEMIRENQEIFKMISDLIQVNGIKVRYVKVKGHSGDVNNDRVDALANSLAQKFILDI